MGGAAAAAARSCRGRRVSHTAAALQTSRTLAFSARRSSDAHLVAALAATLASGVTGSAAAAGASGWKLAVSAEQYR